MYHRDVDTRRRVTPCVTFPDIVLNIGVNRYRGKFLLQVFARVAGTVARFVS